MAQAEDRLVGGRYHLVEPIGRGGMGVVWRAHDRLLDREVAVKEVRHDSVMGDELSDLNRRTMREARAAGRLTHPNVVVVHDVIEEDGRPWIVMQLVPSRSLGQVIRQDGPLSPQRTIEIGLQVLDALRAAHRQGVLHRDVKPENVLLAEDGRVVLTDFGIARIETDATMTRTGLVGTPAFIAPERLRGLPAQRESDLWSLGATLYAAVEGRPPHDRGMPVATMHAVLNEDPAPPRRAGRLGPVLIRLLAKEPADRPGYNEITRLLRQAAREMAAGAGQTGRPPATPPARGTAAAGGRPMVDSAPDIPQTGDRAAGGPVGGAPASTSKAGRPTARYAPYGMGPARPAGKPGSGEAATEPAVEPPAESDVATRVAGRSARASDARRASAAAKTATKADIATGTAERGEPAEKIAGAGGETPDRDAAPKAAAKPDRGAAAGTAADQERSRARSTAARQDAPDTGAPGENGAAARADAEAAESPARETPAGGRPATAASAATRARREKSADEKAGEKESTAEADADATAPTGARAAGGGASPDDPEADGAPASDGEDDTAAPDTSTSPLPGIDEAASAEAARGEADHGAATAGPGTGDEPHPTGSDDAAPAENGSAENDPAGDDSAAGRGAARDRADGDSAPGAAAPRTDGPGGDRADASSERTGETGGPAAAGDRSAPTPDPAAAGKPGTAGSVGGESSGTARPAGTSRPEKGDSGSSAATAEEPRETAAATGETGTPPRPATAGKTTTPAETEAGSARKPTPPDGPSAGSGPDDPATDRRDAADRAPTAAAASVPGSSARQPSTSPQSAPAGVQATRRDAPPARVTWHGVPGGPAVAHRPLPILKLTLALIPALLIIAIVAGYLGMREGRQSSEMDMGATPSAEATAPAGKPGKTPESSASDSAARSQQAAPPPDDASSASPGASAAASPTPNSEPSQASDVPEGWYRYTDKTGFSLALPEGWKVSRRSDSRVWFRGPGTPGSLLIDQTSTPKSNAEKDWRAQEPYVKGSFPGYHRIKIVSVDYWRTAADWEFTYASGSGRMHVINRGFVTDERHGYAIYWSTPHSRWKKDLYLFETFTATFRPAT